MHKCTSLAIHDDTGIAKLLFILATNGATDRDSVYSCIIYFTVFYLYDVVLFYQLLCFYVCILLLCACCALSENDEIKLINQSVNAIYFKAASSQMITFSTHCGITYVLKYIKAILKAIVIRLLSEYTGNPCKFPNNVNRLYVTMKLTLLA